MPLTPPRPAPDRLAPAYYTAVRVPPEVAALASVPDTLAAGSPAKVGILDLAFAVRGGRTELVERYQKTPLQIMRPLWIDPAMPGMSYVYLMATGGGIAQADRYRMDFRCGPGTEVHLTTQAATKIFRMEHDYASQRVHLTAQVGAYVEYLPDPLIPFKDARFYQRTEVTVASGATVVVGDTLTAGRLARGERHAYRAFAADLRIARPDGTLLAIDTLRLDPGARGPGTASWGPACSPGTITWPRSSSSPTACPPTRWPTPCTRRWPGSASCTASVCCPATAAPGSGSWTTDPSGSPPHTPPPGTPSTCSSPAIRRPTCANRSPRQSLTPL